MAEDQDPNNPESSAQAHESAEFKAERLKALAAIETFIDGSPFKSDTVEGELAMAISEPIDGVERQVIAKMNSELLAQLMGTTGTIEMDRALAGQVTEDPERANDIIVYEIRVDGTVISTERGYDDNMIAKESMDSLLDEDGMRELNAAMNRIALDLESGELRYV